VQVLQSRHAAMSRSEHAEMIMSELPVAHATLDLSLGARPVETQASCQCGRKGACLIGD
jgi:hypothetical protein